MQILPGGLFTGKNLQVDVDTLIIDVMAEMNANDNGYCDMGRFFHFLFLTNGIYRDFQFLFLTSSLMWN